MVHLSISHHFLYDFSATQTFSLNFSHNTHFQFQHTLTILYCLYLPFFSVFLFDFRVFIFYFFLIFFFKTQIFSVDFAEIFFPLCNFLLIFQHKLTLFYISSFSVSYYLLPCAVDCQLTAF